MINPNKLAEQVGLLGPASRVGDAHAATERFAILHRAEIIAELTQGVEMPEPFPAGYIAKSEYFHTDKTLRSTVAAAVLREREACAKVCEETHDLFVTSKPSRANAGDCAAAIRNRSKA